VGGGLCTRFATRILSRRTAPGTPELIRVSIKQGDVDPFGDSSDKGTGTFNPAVASMTADVFQNIVQEVRYYLSIKTGIRLTKLGKCRHGIIW
jgi:hypothetical protein